MIIPSFNLTATERVLPRLSLDFTAASIDPRVTFTRSGNTATVVNSSGFVASINADLPRFDYDPVTLACKGLLIEEARTNSFTYSNDLANAVWTKNNVSASTDSTISPDGTANANRITENSSNSLHSVISPSLSFTSGTAYTISIYAKADQRSVFSIVRSGTGGASARFDLSTLTATNLVGTSGLSIINAGNGWYRCSLSWTAGATASRTESIVLENPSGTQTYTGDNVSGMYFYGAQFEVGLFPTSYIPNLTTGTTTRNADIATITSTNFSSWYNAGSGGAVVRVLPSTVLGTRPALQFDDATANEIIALRGNTTNPELVIVDGGSSQAQIDAGTIAANTIYRLAASWNTNDCAASVNGGAPVLDGVATIPTVNQARIGSDGTNYLNGSVESIEYYAGSLLSSNLQVISSSAGYRSIIVPVIRDTIIS